MVGKETGAPESRADVITKFAEELRRLRAAAGNPSYRKMAGISGFISHTTLHEAAAGTRFASWETTREFARACRGDEAEWRARWERARDDLAGGRPADVETPAVRPRRARAAAVLTGAVLLVGLAGVVTGTVLAEEEHAEVPPSAPAGPAIPGDGSRFISDITIPDGTTVGLGETFVKVWEIQNSGTVLWRNRYLQRDDLPVPPGGCRTPDRIPVGDTLPNERVKISVTVTAPDRPSSCMVKWKMIDHEGRQFFPTARPIYFLVHVADKSGEP
jgi:hypothetical protein